jgi:hypothetical protein
MHDPASGLNLPEKCTHGVDLHFTCVDCEFPGDPAEQDKLVREYYEEHPDD